MKKFTPALAISLALAASSAFASDGTITINGEVSAVTCRINFGSPNLTVNLPKVQASAFSAASPTTGRTQFLIKLDQCTNFTGKYARVYFEPTTADAAGYLKNTTGTGYATGVAVKLTNQRGAFINTNLSVDLQQDPAQDGFPLSSSLITMPYYAEYVATGTVTPGLVATSVVYDIHYW